jgi:hypothetical protein
LARVVKIPVWLTVYDTMHLAESRLFFTANFTHLGDCDKKSITCIMCR